MLSIILFISIYFQEIQDKDKINKILDKLHLYASEANGNKYFELYSDDAVFFGTDATERWSINEFKDYALERFNSGTGWTYKTINRNIFINENTAWFDEELINEKYGVFRGTGVLVKNNDKWLITQYNLLLPIPNDLLLKYADEIKQFLKNDN